MRLARIESRGSSRVWLLVCVLEEVLCSSNRLPVSASELRLEPAPPSPMKKSSAAMRRLLCLSREGGSPSSHHRSLAGGGSSPRCRDLNSAQTRVRLTLPMSSTLIRVDQRTHSKPCSQIASAASASTAPAATATRILTSARFHRRFHAIKRKCPGGTPPPTPRAAPRSTAGRRRGRRSEWSGGSSVPSRQRWPRRASRASCTSLA